MVPLSIPLLGNRFSADALKESGGPYCVSKDPKSRMTGVLIRTDTETDRRTLCEDGSDTSTNRGTTRSGGTLQKLTAEGET